MRLRLREKVTKDAEVFQDSDDVESRFVGGVVPQVTKDAEVFQDSDTRLLTRPSKLLSS